MFHIDIRGESQFIKARYKEQYQKLRPFLSRRCHGKLDDERWWAMKIYHKCILNGYILSLKMLMSSWLFSALCHYFICSRYILLYKKFTTPTEEYDSPIQGYMRLWVFYIFQKNALISVNISWSSPETLPRYKSKWAKIEGLVKYQAISLKLIRILYDLMVAIFTIMLQKWPGNNLYLYI